MYRGAGWVSMPDWLGFEFKHAKSLNGSGDTRVGSAGGGKRKRAVSAPWSAHEQTRVCIPALSSFDPAARQVASRSVDQPALVRAAVDSIDGSLKKARWSKVRGTGKPSLRVYIRWGASVGVHPLGAVLKNGMRVQVQHQ